MLDILTGTLRIIARRWPALLAIFLAGWIARFLIIRFAGWVANIDPLLGLLVLPVAVLIRLAAYVAMFLVLRRDMPGFTRFEGLLDPEETGSEARRFSAIIQSSILPFFVVFATWGLLRDDFVEFSLAQLQQRTYNGDEPELDVTATPITIGVVILAFALRWLLKRFAERLPTWTGYVAAYLEAVWIFVAVVVLQDLLAGLPAWLQSRRVVAFFIDIIDAAREAFAPLRFLLDGVAWVIDHGSTTIVLPLAWLTLAGIVYARALTGVSLDHDSPAQLAKARKRWEAFPPALRRRLADLASGFTDRWQPISSSARLIWGTGPAVVGLFLLLTAVVETLGLWLHFGIDRAIGPHSIRWWMATDVPLSIVIETIVEVARIALIAAAYDYSLRLLARRRELTPTEAAEQAAG